MYNRNSGKLNTRMIRLLYIPKAPTDFEICCLKFQIDMLIGIGFVI